MTDLPYVAVDIRLLVLLAQILGALRLFFETASALLLAGAFFFGK